MSNMMSTILYTVYIIIFLAFVVSIIEFTVPIIVKADFDRECDYYLDKSVDAGGLTVSETMQLVAKIEAMSPNINIVSYDITRSGSVAYKDDVHFVINATYSLSTITSTFTRSNKNYPLYYEKQFANRRIIN